MNADVFKKIKIPFLLAACALISVIMITESVRAALPAGRSVGIESGAEGLYLTLPGISEASYEIHVKNDLTNTVWQKLGTLEAVDGENIYPISPGSEPSQVFRALFPQPVLAAAEPAFLSAAGSNTVYVTGQFFYEGDLIRVGGVLLSNVTFISSTLLSGTLPTQPDGIYDVEVVSGHNGAVLATLNDALHVSPPLELTLQEPPTWPPAGPAPVPNSNQRIYNKRKFAQSELSTVARDYLDEDSDDDTVLDASLSMLDPFRGHVTVLKNHLDPDDDGDGIPTAGVAALDPFRGHVTVLKNHVDPDDDGDGIPTAGLAALDPFRGHVTVLKAHLDPDDDGDGIPTASVSPGVIAGIAIGAAIAPGGGHVTVLKSHQGDGYGDTEVQLHSGEVQQQATDLAVEGRGLDFAWVRTYRSRTGQDSPQGTRWSHSYDVRCVQDGGAVHIFDGTGRKDTFRLQADGTYTCPGFFREGTITGGIFRLTFADTGFWEFNPLATGGTADGKLARIQDRHGNAITCNYDGAGRLQHVIDTLDRTNSVAYTLDDRVASVTDCTGRTVTYAYYSSVESGGTTGDLKSVTSPPVTSTPNGNDFPSGKTTTFTYSTGQTDDRANHLLLTVTDALGQTAATCGYDLNPASESFQRCVSISNPGEPLDVLYLGYMPQAPAPGNSFAAMRCIVNDAVGNVTESFFDLRNRCVTLHQYTGRSEPGAPVTATANRPAGKLRAGDPDRYETLLSWNNDSLCTRLTLPGGSTCRNVYAGDANADTRARKRPDLLLQEWDAKATGGADSNGDGTPDLFKITKTFTYDPRFSSDPSSRYQWDCDDDGAYARGWDGTFKGKRYGGFMTCDQDDWEELDEDCASFVTSVTDARGTVTTAEYDDQGNLTRTTASIDNAPVVEFAYNAFGQRTSITNALDANGLRRVDTIQWSTHPLVVVCDAGDIAITNTVERDERGNVTRYIDPNGNDTLYTYNALDQLVACSSSPYGENGGQRVATSYFYDANNNVVQIDTENRHDTGGAVGSNPLWTTDFEYDALNRCVAVAQELDPTTTITNRFEYDANGQLTARLSPLAVSGDEPQNRVAYVYDERCLLFRETVAPGSLVAATNEWAYTADGCPASKRYADNSVALFDYDGFSRIKSRTDSEGNNINWSFNGAGDLTRSRTVGENDYLFGAAVYRLLSESSWSYDGLGRCTHQVDSFFDVFTEVAIDDGARTTQFEYAPSGQRTTVIDDLGATNSYAYDTAGRLVATTGPRGDTRVCVRDANGNATRVTQTDLSDLGGNPQQFICDYTYDALDRCVSSVDNVGNTNRWFYDSRDLLVRTTDPRGNETRILYDGLCRSTGSISYVGPCDADDKSGIDRGITINTSHVEYDSNSRVTSVTDDNTNSTTYAYDTRDRRVLETCPDGTTHQFVWSSRSNLVQEEDACGTVIDCIYDPLNRLVRKDITPGSNVVASTTFETFAYDGLSRCIAASNDVSATTIVYDSLGSQVRCVTDGAPVLFTKNVRGSTTSITYPSGIAVSYTYDPLQQVKTVTVASQGQTNNLATYDYDGPGRLARITRNDGSTSEILWNGLVSSPNPAGDYGWQGVAAISHGAAGGGLIDERIFSYDRSQNKTLRALTHAFDPGGTTCTTNTWEYDALCRQRGAVTCGDVVVTRNYVLDGKGNRISVTNNAVEELYVRSAIIPPADFQMDQYTQTPSSGLQTYDAAGRRTGDSNAVAQTSSHYDYAGRLEQVDAMGAGGSFEPLVSFGYDAFGRRISKTVYGSGIPPETTQYLYDGVDNDCDGTPDDDNILETYVDGSVTGTRIYGHGGGGGGVIRMLSPPLAILTGTQGVPLFTRCDDLGNVLALTDVSGTVVERYEYSDFGEPQFLALDGSPLTDAGGSPVTSSPAGNPYLFHGMQWDSETGLYLDPRQGRYVDPLSGQYTTRSNGSDQETHSRAFADNNPWTGGGSTRATDHNSSRSNKTSHTPAFGGGGDGGGGSSTRATDHNSSRSNKTSHTPAAGGGGGGGGGGNGTRATDYNSSRSNRVTSSM